MLGLYIYEFTDTKRLLENWLGGRDSNPDRQIQSLQSYRWTTSQQHKEEPQRQRVFSTARRTKSIGSLVHFFGRQRVLMIATHACFTFEMRSGSIATWTDRSGSIKAAGFQTGAGRFTDLPRPKNSKADLKGTLQAQG
jgi:hypothetical protein